jgi:hypothetical protein
MAQKEGINTPLVITIGAISAILLAVIAFGVQGWFQYEEQLERDAKWQTMGNTAAPERRAEQLKAISDYRVVDAKKGVVAIPIERAMEIIADNGGKLPQAAN